MDGLTLPSVYILSECGQVAEGDLPLVRRPVCVPVCHGSGAGVSNPAQQRPNLGPSTSCSAFTVDRLEKLHNLKLQFEVHFQSRQLYNYKCTKCFNIGSTPDFQSFRERQRDVVYLGWPMAPSYMSPNAGGGGLRISSNEYSCAHGAQINFGDLTTCITYACH